MASRTLIALLRGINVGGRNKLPMKELVAALEAVGAADVRTYIQSGNAVFRAAKGTPKALGERLAAELLARKGFAPAVLVLTLAELERALERNPYPEAEAEPKSVHLGFLASVPKAPDLAALEAARAQGERFHLAGRVFYLHAPIGFGTSKLAAGAERWLGVPMTARNWRTCRAVAELAR